MSSTIIKSCIDDNLTDKELKVLALKGKDWNLAHGVVVKSRDNFSEDHVQIIPFMLLPTPFPRKEFERAKELQTLLNELMHKVAHDHEFLCDALKNTVQSDPFTLRLFNIYETVHSEGFFQSMSLGLLRSDYMLHEETNKIKQIETNMISSSFAGLTPLITEYQRYILMELGHEDKVKNIPKNNALCGFAIGLMEAWELYAKKESVLMFVVEDTTYNVYDQRIIEFKIRQLKPEVKIIRKTFDDLIIESKLGTNKELLVEELEVAVVYYRTGYQEEAYTSEKRWEVRLLIERSKAIKCPSIQYQLAGTKKVQQILSQKGSVEKFISETENVNRIRDVFVDLYSIDLNENGDKAVEMALNDPEKYVLKPQREGGGNNLYSDDLKKHLENIKESKEREAFILMEKINAPQLSNYLIKAGEDLKMQDFISELGIYGIVMGNQHRIMMNSEVGHLLRTKTSTSDEGGIIQGSGALDNPYLF